TARRQDYNFIRAATRRYDREIGVRANVRSPGTYGKNPETHFRDQLNEDLILGDTRTAARRIQEHFKGWSPERQKIELQNFKVSIAGRQPIKAGAGGGDREAGRISFLRWAQVRLPEDQVALIKRADETYRRSAQALELMRPDQLVPEINLQRAMQRIKTMAQ